MVFCSVKKFAKLTVFCIPEWQRYDFSVIFSRTFFYIIYQCEFQCIKFFSVIFSNKFSYCIFLIMQRKLIQLLNPLHVMQSSKRNLELSIEHSFIAVLAFFNAIISKKPHENQFICWRFCKEYITKESFPFPWPFINLIFVSFDSFCWIKCGITVCSKGCRGCLPINWKLNLESPYIYILLGGLKRWPAGQIRSTNHSCLDFGHQLNE